ncbi:MAG: LacI family DNA-binding transcriptional regulator [Sphaerochaetaceae bacterium]|jgi:LacI family transcriptional regulator|nr:LacI family transcriptional regulator [Sphaerochaetaceae bacterium]NLO61198.1 LacI family transcriptional regulator [Spirochaetales bacterium]MDD3670499.1 LacI family DNA-binding transcriptional regulator [Sphaerochaetaceae bacterium]MDD4259439.1 LacI family DNA-binding transcriptional regulator [Sphaerochaetaceae bacterium]MDD4763580.1 LacI family DNA-binding transcriptional regulator [Sphaerochaetaceae bacterium]
MKMKKITIDDIARQVGVSKATVSRVINNKKYVDSETKKKIMAVIEETGFTPQTSAVKLSMGKTDVIGLLVPSLSNPYSLTVIQGVAEQIAQCNYELMLYTTGLSEENQKKFLQKISHKNVDGLVVLLPRDSSALEVLLSSTDIPLVLIDHRGIDTHLHTVSVTNEKGGFDATEYLISLGHERIGFITGVMEFGCSKDRLDGYTKALEAHHIDVDQELIVNGDFTESSGFNAMCALLQHPKPPTSVFCSNDDMAIGAIRAIQHSGLRVPEDISVIGFDDTVRASMAYPSLTTIKQPLLTMGATAANLVRRLIDKEAVEPTNVVLNTELIIRNSCASR